MRLLSKTMFILGLMSISLVVGGSTALSKTIEYKVNGKTYEGYYLHKSNSAPFVLLMHDWDGLTEYEIKRSQMLFEKGYSVFALDLFGKGIRPTEVKDKRQHTGELYKDRKKMRAIMQGALQSAKKQGANIKNAVAMGYCFGGAAVLELARSGAKLKSFVTFHGGLSTPDGQDYSQTKGSILVFHGSADSAVSMQEFASLTNQLEKNGIAHEMISYGGAPHAFTVFGGDRYQKAADQKSWARFLDWLKHMEPEFL